MNLKMLIDLKAGPCRTINSSGCVQVSGGKDLKLSQHYPVRFGRSVCEWFLNHSKEIRRTVDERAKLGFNTEGFQF